MSVQRAFADSTDVDDVSKYINKLNSNATIVSMSGLAKGKNVILISPRSTQQLVSIVN